MKEAQLRAAATCAHCRKKIGESRVPLFYALKIERHMLNLAALQRQNGLAMMLGGSGRLAAIMGPDEDLTENLMDNAVAITICEDCSTRSICVAQLAEYALPVTPPVMSLLLPLLASVPLPSVDYSTLWIDALGAAFVVFMLGVLVGCILGTRYGKARQQARSQRPVTTLFSTSTQPDKYDK